MGLISNIKGHVRRSSPFVAAAMELRQRLKRGHVPIYLDYPIFPAPRYGWEKPPHSALNEAINAHRSTYGEWIRQLSGVAGGLEKIPLHAPKHSPTAHWMNDWVMGLDAATLYAFPCLFGSRVYLEIGSGNSTKFVRQSILDNQLSTRIVSIDPHPRAEIDRICDEVVRQPLEHVDLSLFDALEAGDILMVDNSHRCFQNSDVTAVFLDILPRIKSGVAIYIDDIFLPYDYPPDWVNRYYSEQYLLAVQLLADNARRYEILFPGYFATMDPSLKALADGFWTSIGRPEMHSVISNGFWLRVK